MRPLLLLPAVVAWAAVLSAPVAPAAAHSFSHDENSCRSDSKVVKASWYGRHWRGRRTASGDRFDDRLLTAASLTIPFHTLVKVVNLITGAIVHVRINDRGPFVAGRGLDLSERAAHLLGITKAGIQVVSVEIEEKDLTPYPE